MADTDTQANCEDVCRGGEEAGLEKRHYGADGQRSSSCNHPGRESLASSCKRQRRMQTKKNSLENPRQTTPYLGYHSSKYTGGMLYH